MGKQFSEIENFYQNEYDENNRMVRNPIEFIRCKEIISRFLKNEEMVIADIGGATGVFSYWLQEQGHKVHLLDYTENHIERAKENGKNKGLMLESYVWGDARQTPYADEQFDIVLEMGPLYHLQDSDDRVKCLKEANRLLKNKCVVICEVISRYANIFEGFQKNLISDEEFIKILDENLLTGKHNPKDTPYFTTAFFHTPDLMKNELEQAGFTDITMVAIEGFASIIDTDSFLNDEIRKNLLLKYIRDTESIRDIFGVSSHFMAIGVKYAE